MLSDSPDAGKGTASLLCDSAGESSDSPAVRILCYNLQTEREMTSKHQQVCFIEMPAFLKDDGLLGHAFNMCMNVNKAFRYTSESEKSHSDLFFMPSSCQHWSGQSESIDSHYRMAFCNLSLRHLCNEALDILIVVL